MKTWSPFPALALAALTCLLSAAACDAHADGGRLLRSNAAGGSTATAWVQREGPRDASVQRARGVATDGQGNAVAGAAGRWSGPGGATAERRAQVQRSADGAATATSSRALDGARGSVQSDASVARSADGQVQASRDTTAVRTATGNSVQRSVQYDSSSGLTRSYSCHDASGAPMACR